MKTSDPDFLKLFGNKLKEIKETEKFNSIIMDNVCPPSLLDDFKDANLEGYNLRTKLKLTVRTLITKKGIVLIAKGPNEKFTERKFTKQNQEKNET